MTPTAEVLAFAIIAAVATLIGVRWLESIGLFRLGPSPVDEQSEELSELRGEVTELKRLVQALQEENDTQRKRIDFLVDELVRRGGGIGQAVPADIATQHARQLPVKPLLLICSGDMDEICRADRESIRRAGLRFQRMIGATKESVVREIRRRRQNGDMYPWIHVGAHADARGVHLADGIADARWWQEQLTGVEVLFLNGCSTTAIADILAGFVDYVVTVGEDIENDDAAAFTYAFWRRLADESRRVDPTHAYDEALVEVPQVSEFTDIRSG